MKKSAGRRLRRQIAAANRREDSDKKQAINEQKLLHFSRMNGEFRNKLRSLSLLKGANT